MFDRLDCGVLHRPGGSGCHGRISVDFRVNDRSLYEATGASRRDMCGRFSSDLKPKHNKQSEKAFRTGTPADTDDGRLMLFVCPECGDLGCGAVTFRLTIRDDRVVWSEFAYENGYEAGDFETLAHLGPFEFEREQYRTAIAVAAS
jgi:hypothetical protein